MGTIARALPIRSLRNWRKRLRFELSLSKFLQLRFNLFLLSVWPISFTKAYVWILSRLYFFFRPGLVSAVRNNVARGLRGRTPQEVDEIVRGVLKGMIRHYQEKMYNGFLAMPKFRKYLASNVIFDGYERVLTEALKEGRGVIIATAHYGALEFLPIYLAMRNYETVTLARFQSERLKNITIPRANGDGLDIVVPGNGTNVFREASKVLSENKIFVTQCDEAETWHEDAKSNIEFMGRKMHPDRMLDVLCRRTGAVLLFGVLERQQGGKYRLFLHRVDRSNSHAAGAKTLKLLESYIFRHPDQWYEWKKYHRFGTQVEPNERANSKSKDMASEEGSHQQRPLSLKGLVEAKQATRSNGPSRRLAG
jgi:lauroyl/myristoyl acyltransferase